MLNLRKNFKKERRGKKFEKRKQLSNEKTWGNECSTWNNCLLTYGVDEIESENTDELSIKVTEEDVN